MATYAIGDVQGCYRELRDLLDLINFSESEDRLWFTGDLVNRGPDSLAVLRFVRDLGDSAVVVLGNHDLHLLAVAEGTKQMKSRDTLRSLLEADDAGVLLTWLRTLPFVHRDPGSGFNLLHAGLPPQWDCAEAEDHGRELAETLDSARAPEFLRQMYGDKPDRWSPDLGGWERLRFICNCFTRMRFCDAAGRLALDEKGPPGSQPKTILPWYEVADRRSQGEKIIFGHWSTIHLGGRQDFGAWKVVPLDTGCVWGGTLTALRLEDQRYFSVPSRQPKRNEL